MDDTNYGNRTPTPSGQPTTTVPMDVFIQALQALSNNNNQLQGPQKEVRTQFLAIRNAHGDFGPKREDKAFFDSTLVLQSKKLKFTTRPSGTAKLSLLKAGGASIVTVDAANLPQEVTLDDAQANELVAVEAVDANGVLIGITIPRRT